MAAPPDGTKLARIAAVQSMTVALVEQSGAVVICAGAAKPGSASVKVWVAPSQLFWKYLIDAVFQMYELVMDVL